MLEGTRTGHRRLHMDQRASLAEEWEELQHGRPSPRAGNDGHGHASIGHEEDERTHRFAKQTAAWVEAEVAKRGITDLHAFCAPRFLGPLRGTLSERMQGLVNDHAIDLSNLTEGELAVHVAVATAAEALSVQGRPHPGHSPER